MFQYRKDIVLQLVEQLKVIKNNINISKMLNVGYTPK